MINFGKLKSYDLEFVNFITGGVILTYELVASRIVTPYIGGTIYTWTSIIGVILAALSAGYWYGGKLADKRHDRNDIVLLLIAAAALLIIVNLTKDKVLTSVSSIDWPLQWQAFLAGVILFAAPTFLLGAISPYLTRLSITDIKTSGQRVARMSAWGTAGSLLGTFLTGYVILGYMGTKLIIFSLTITLLLASFIISRKVYTFHRLFVALLAVFTILLVPKISLFGLVADEDSRYNRIIVRDITAYGQPTRVLQTDAGYVQSGVNLNDSSGLSFPYIRAFAFVAKYPNTSRSSLVIGGGAFTLPAYLANTYPDMTVDTVEIDNELAAISKQYLGFVQKSNSRIINDDGRRFLNKNKNLYDLIFIDAYAPHTPPFQLATKEAIGKVKSALSSGGVVAVNALSGADAGLTDALLATYKSVFPYVAIFPADPTRPPGTSQNIIILASVEPLNQATLVKNAQNVEERSFVDNLSIVNKTKNTILSDDFAPVERLAGRN